jgi:hypothetical protein
MHARVRGSRDRKMKADFQVLQSLLDTHSAGRQRQMERLLEVVRTSLTPDLASNLICCRNWK